MTVFKLERERPAYDTYTDKSGDHVLYIKDRAMRQSTINGDGPPRDIPLVSLRRTTSNAVPGIGGGVRSLHNNNFNKTEHNVLTQSDAEGGLYELITFQTDSAAGGDNAQDVKRGAGLSAIFVARDKFAVLGKDRQLQIKSVQNGELQKKMSLPNPGVESLYPGGSTNRIILKSENSVTLWDMQSRKVIYILALTAKQS
jgi:coatomer protein complex subunit alpha (xenin)